MYDLLYIISGAIFVSSVAAYCFFCVKLSEDILAGKIRVKLETQKS